MTTARIIERILDVLCILALLNWRYPQFDGSLQIFVTVFGIVWLAAKFLFSKRIIPDEVRKAA